MLRRLSVAYRLSLLSCVDLSALLGMRHRNCGQLFVPRAASGRLRSEKVAVVNVVQTISDTDLVPSVSCAHAHVTFRIDFGERLK